MSNPFQCQNKCTPSLTQGWTWPVAERHTVCAGRTASGWCHLHKSKRWRRPRAEWWKTSSGGRMLPCPWWTGQRSSRLAGLKRMESVKLKRKIKTNQVSFLCKPTSLLLQAEAQHSLQSLIFKSKIFTVVIFICMSLTRKHHHVLEIGFDLVASSKIKKKWQRVDVSSSTDKHRHLGRNKVKEGTTK